MKPKTLQLYTEKNTKCANYAFTQRRENREENKKKGSKESTRHKQKEQHNKTSLNTKKYTLRDPGTTKKDTHFNW